MEWGPRRSWTHGARPESDPCLARAPPESPGLPVLPGKAPGEDLAASSSSGAAGTVACGHHRPVSAFGVMWAPLCVFLPLTIPPPPSLASSNKDTSPAGFGPMLLRRDLISVTPVKTLFPSKVTSTDVESRL